MIKKRTLFLFAIAPLILGFMLANFQAKPKTQNVPLSFATGNILPNDQITLSVSGNIYKLNNSGSKQEILGQNLIEPVNINGSVVAVSKTTNNSSLIMFSENGEKLKTLFNGNSQSIDDMSWATDPASSPTRDRIAYVSDKDKGQTLVPDNALYVLNLATGKSTHIAKPYPYSGGIAHPTFDPQNPNILLYDYYQYDPDTL